MDKIFISSDMMEKDSWKFAVDLHKTSHTFDWVVGVTRGGAQISVYVQEALSMMGDSKKSYATVHASSYTGIGEAGCVKVSNLEHLLAEIGEGETILVLDDVFDRGKTLEAVKFEMEKRLEGKSVKVIIGALYYKPENSQVSIVPDYYFKTFKGEDWLVFPHELCGLTREELTHKGFPEF